MNALEFLKSITNHAAYKEIEYWETKKTNAGEEAIKKKIIINLLQLQKIIFSGDLVWFIFVNDDDSFSIYIPLQEEMLKKDMPDFLKEKAERENVSIQGGSDKSG